MQRYTPEKNVYSAPLRWPQFPWGKLHTATVVTCGIFFLGLAISISWLLGEPTLSQTFAGLNELQLHPPTWVQLPATSTLVAWVPSIVLIVMAQAIMMLSPRPQRWSRWLVVGLLIATILRYVFWRSLATLNLSEPVDGIFSLLLYGMEMMGIASMLLQRILLLGVKSRRPEAELKSEAVVAGTYQPTVDILIPTYNEPAAILRRTAIGCQAIAYPRKQVYLLDDGNRPEIRQLAAQLGCHYISRPSSIHAKAGNLNYALGKTRGELVTVFDADFVPTSNFLTRTVGFFQDRSVGLVQTHQSFFSPDPVSRNLGLEREFPQEVEIFSRHYQPIRDTNGTALCYGSSFVVRRSALEDVNGFVTESLSEDYYTGVHLSSKGNRVVYLDESLSAGLCADNMTGHVLQRQRWVRGTIQSFFIRINPVTMPGFNWLQRLSHLEGISQWFFSLFRVVFLLMPLAYVIFGAIPMRTSLQEWLYFFLPFFVLNLLTYSWLNGRSRSAIASDIYDVAQCIPVSLALVQTLLKPFSVKFQVTPKGVSSDRHIFNWNLAWPLIVLWSLSAVALTVSVNVALGGSLWLPMPDDPKLLEGMRLAWVWSAYNLFVLSIAIMLMRDAPKPSMYEWFERRIPVQLRVGERRLSAITTAISEVGAELQVQNWNDEKAGTARTNHEKTPLVEFSIPNTAVRLTSSVISVRPKDSNGASIRVHFESLSDIQLRALVEFLYCQPGQWQAMQAPSEWRSLWLMVKVFFSPCVWGLQRSYEVLLKGVVK
ncbi:MAG: glycosyltransferase [Synechococcus sp.]